MANENINETKMEYKDLTDSTKETKNKKNINFFNNKNMMLIAIFLVLIVILIISISFFASNKKYTVKLNYNYIKSEVSENISEVKVELLGEKKDVTEYSLSDEISLTELKKGDYTVNVSLVNSDGDAYYYGSTKVFADSDKSVDIDLVKEEIIYDLKYRWVGNDVEVTLPENFDNYLIFKLSDGVFVPDGQSNSNKVWLRGIKTKESFRFAVVKDKKIYEYSESLELIKNNSPTVPVILSPELNKTLPVDVPFYIIWECSDPDGDELKYDVIINDGTKEEKAASDITEKMFNYKGFEKNKVYTIKVVAKDTYGDKSESEISVKSEIFVKTYQYVSAGNQGVIIKEVVSPQVSNDISSIKTGGKVTKNIKADNYLYILRDLQGITIADISDNKNPKIIKNIDLADVNDISINNDYMYLKQSDSRVSVYNINNRINPEFLGFSDVQYFGSENPKINIVTKEINIKIDIITSEYPVRIGLNDKVYVSGYSVVVGSTSSENYFKDNYYSVVENLKLIFSMYKKDDFKDKNKVELIKNKILNSLNEMMGKNEETGVKEIILNISNK